MATDAGIILQTNPVQSIDPIKTVSQLLAVKNAQIENAVRQQQIQQAAAQTQDIQAQAAQRQKEVSDQNTLQEIMRDPVQGPKVAGGDFTPVYGKVSPDYLDKVRQSTQAYHTQLAANTKTDLENANTAAGQATDAITGLKQLGDVDRINAELPNTVQRLTDAGVLKALKIDPASAPKSISSTNDLDAWAAHMGVLQAATGKALALKEAQEKEQGTVAETGEKNASAREKSATAAHQEMVNKMMTDAQGGVQNGQHPIDAILGKVDPAAAAAYKPAYDAAMAGGGPEAAKAMLTAAAEHAATLSPANVKKDVDKAVAVESATSPMKVAQQVAAAKALREGDNPAFAGVPPAQAAATQSAAIKLDQEYSKAKASADSIKMVLDMAAQGNKAAGANAPLVGVGAVNAVNGIKRINSAEIAQYGTAGSLIDKIQGKLQGWTEGQPIPKDVLDDMQALHNELRKSSYQQYTDGLNSLNLRSGSKLQPAFDAPQAASTGIASPKSKIEYDALPKGAHYLKNGVEMVKQ